MAVTAAASGHLGNAAMGLAARNTRDVKFGNGELMGQKLKYAKCVQRVNNMNVRLSVCMSLTTNIAGEAKVSS